MAIQGNIFFVLTGLLLLSFSPAGLADGAAPATLKKGEALFIENCEACHQADAIGQPGVAPSLTNPELLSTASD